MAKEHESPLIPPPQVNKPTTNIVDLEAGAEQNQCRICLESDRRGFIAPCLCKGTSKYVHRDCLDQWRSVKEGFAFAHCTTCKAQYHLRVNAFADKKCRTLKFRFFVTRDIVTIFIVVQLAIALLATLVYFVDLSQKFGLLHALHFHAAATFAVGSFYYICGAVLFFALFGLSGCLLTCFSSRARDALDQPCKQLTDSCCCCCTGTYADSPSHSSGPTICIWTDPDPNSTCCCADSGSNNDSDRLVMVVIVLAIFVIFGLFYSILVAIVAWQRIWQRHYHILAKRMLTKEYIVEDVDGLTTDPNWSAPPLPPEHVEQLKALRLL
ncbi:hypothetical protein MKW94_028790 [Papaver nudicaule]|uniref:RING-CH-type domain-containing protein n=1 Tax=Papaver nudicaule TaxID=74823 RepID=A0AA42B0D6_PAPNU|nr:hypothetical protein [Papaver nudicaule]